jgi:hypothetical protein
MAKQRNYSTEFKRQVVLEVHRPARVRCLGHQHGLPLGPGDPLSLAFPHLQALLDKDPVHRLGVDAPTLAAQQRVQASIAETLASKS